ncbi:hypothetical protein HYH02_014434 [Chlamydomonas schloesseri]|uniref:Uncharacterized protein n=1 Tax=Chlamydomonas schloesseri TaxID=2026947 RepID=A0A835SNB6_9CHLO|nr:hypothetical protein HYH02_014434 [Chlamydomonas schloesseri]|eukprot:KAG2428252.1 hypothetical protein HYH02_014434 [Chlamydomonas schloesseri]
MLRRGGALISAAHDSLRAAAATAATGSSLLVSASAPSTSPAAACGSSCCASFSSGCHCLRSSVHAPACGCSTCAAASPAGLRSAVPTCTSHAAGLTRAARPEPPGPLHPYAPTPAASLPFSLRGLHTSAASPSAPAAPAADGSAERGRRSRRPEAADAAGPGPGGARGRPQQRSLLPSDGEAGEEVQAVLDKLVGGLIRGGRKGTARRIVEDALLHVRRQLKKGGLEDLK